MKRNFVAVTGADGFIGKYLQNALEAAGHPTIGITRSGAAGTRAVGDLEVQPRWQTCLRGVDTVVHCAAETHVPRIPNRLDIEHLYRVNVAAVEALAEACLQTGVRRLVLMSSVKVYGESTSDRPPFSETDPLSPEDDYGRSKCQAEAVIDQYADDGLQVCSLRLPLVYGPYSKGNFLRLKKLALSGLPLPLGGIDNRRSVLSLSNLAKVLDELISQDEWPYQHLNVADPGAVSVSELVRMIALSHGRKSRLLSVPIPVLKFFAKVISREPIVQRLTNDLEMDTRRLRQYMPALSMETTKTCLAVDQNLEANMGNCIA